MNNKTIAHIGFGAFHRGHQLVYTNTLVNEFGSDWRYCEVSLFSTGDIQKLRDQNHRFSVLEQDAEHSHLHQINVINESWHPKLDGVETVIERLSKSDVKIISLTITEKGYSATRDSLNLDVTNPKIQGDIESARKGELTSLQTAIAYLYAVLKRRKEKGVGGLSLLSCDNIQQNGKVLKAVVVDFCRAVDEVLANWVDDSVSFPSSMVDRIVPAMTVESKAILAQASPFQDECGVVCEPFKQWVIEDDFCQGRPAWEKVDVQIVDDVLPFEELKLRLLNGAHSFMAYLGALAGYETVSDVMEDRVFQQGTLKLMKLEQAKSLTIPDGFDVSQYINDLLIRFKNPKLKHRTSQIAMDGSQKMAQRFFPALFTHFEGNRDVSLSALALAAWIRYSFGQSEQGQAFEVDDPQAELFQLYKTQHGMGLEAVKAILKDKHIMPAFLLAHLGYQTFVEQVCEHFESLIQVGAKASLEKLTGCQ